jgi:hypothetical protein
VTPKSVEAPGDEEFKKELKEILAKARFVVP